MLIDTHNPITGEIFTKRVYKGRPNPERIVVTDKGFWYVRMIDTRGMMGRLHKWLVLTKDPSCKRGDYAEEFDVLAPTVTVAKRIAQAVMDAEFEPCLRISRIIWRGEL